MNLSKSEKVHFFVFFHNFLCMEFFPLFQRIQIQDKILRFLISKF